MKATVLWQTNHAWLSSDILGSRVYLCSCHFCRCSGLDYVPWFRNVPPGIRDDNKNVHSQKPQYLKIKQTNQKILTHITNSMGIWYIFCEKYELKKYILKCLSAVHWHFRSTVERLHVWILYANVYRNFSVLICSCFFIFPF